jgi:hypothetical protein
MKKLIAAILAVIMLAGLTACISEDPGKLLADDTKLSAKEKEQRAEYYKTWASSEDFGTEGKYMSMDLMFGETRFVMQVTDVGMTMVLGDSEAAMFQKDGKMYAHIKAVGEDSAPVDEWYVADVPEGEDPSLFDAGENDFQDGSGFGTVEYVDTIKEGGKTYDVLNITGKGMFGDEDTDQTYKGYVNADTHKLSRVEISTTMESADENAENKTVAVTGTISFIDALDFTVPANATEQSYEELSMTFAFTMMAIMFSNPSVANIFN